MNGTKSPTTFLIDLTPPMMTNAVTAIMTIPVTTIGTLNELFKARRNSKRRETQQRPSRDAAHCLPLGKRSVPSLDTKKDCRPMRCLQSETVHDLSFSFSFYERMAATTSST